MKYSLQMKILMKCDQSFNFWSNEKKKLHTTIPKKRHKKKIVKLPPTKTSERLTCDS